jgi:hypothetical protein
MNNQRPSRQGRCNKGIFVGWLGNLALRALHLGVHHWRSSRQQEVIRFAYYWLPGWDLTKHDESLVSSTEDTLMHCLPHILVGKAMNCFASLDDDERDAMVTWSDWHA